MDDKLKILYEDNHILVIFKDKNILSQKDHTNDDDISTLAKEYLKKKYNKPGNVYLGLVHRLDKNTRGIMVLAKTSKAAQRLSLDFSTHKIKKKYLAVCQKSKKLFENTYLENYLFKDESKNMSFVVDDKTKKLAKLEYTIVDQFENYALVDINLLTGRHHQIRVQFANINAPLYGDVKYGGIKNDEFFLGLINYYLEFTHPVKKEVMKFTYYSNDSIFSKFNYIKNK